MSPRFPVACLKRGLDSCSLHPAMTGGRAARTDVNGLTAFAETGVVPTVERPSPALFAD